ncbi:hypothetical protein MAP00_008485 [Monascus purpureus]|nr:hypothetical protein MAP00_008485 [Monascus purpureus]
MKHTLHLTTRSRLQKILAGSRLQGTVSMRPRLRMPSPWSTVTSSMKAFATKSQGRKSMQTAMEERRRFPTSGFEVIETDQLVEEEELPDYRADRFYPVQLGEVFHDRYQVITKLGFGSSSTTWLARDLKVHQYVALKVLLDSFEAVGPDGHHIVLVFEAAQMSLRDMKLVFRQDGFDEDFIRGAIIELLKALDFLHTQGEIVHTDVHPGNMLLGIFNNDLLRNLEEKEFTNPVPRKLVSSTRTIYLSRLMRPKEGPMLLSDFGEARIGPGPHGGDIMPLEYRAPETFLYVGWSYPVDIWSVGLTAWDLLEPKKLFTARDEDGDLYDAAHLAQIIAALGPPPPEFLAKNPERRADFWDDQGEWLGLAPIPHGRTMEALETRLEDKLGFLRFIRRALAWIPEERPTAKELLQDPWLAGEKA